MTTPRPDPRVGTDLGPYRIEAVVGRGGMGVVYRATDTRLDRRVALKVLAPELAEDETFRQRFLRESRLAASIDDPNIIPVYEAGESDGVFFLAMRYVEGTDLEARLRAGPLTPAEAVHLLGQVASALDGAHEAGLVHRDVKPANVLIASGKGPDRPDHAYLTDFGLTKHRGSQTGATRAGSFLGTLDYIAPEQIEGRDVDGRADEYALACMAFQCLTGMLPFVRENDAAVLMAHLRDAPPLVSHSRADLPAAADEVVARGMAKSPDARFPTSGAFVAALRQALGVRPTEERAAPVRGGRRTVVAVAGIAALAIGILAVAYLALASAPGSAPTPSTPLGTQVPSIGIAGSPSPISTAFPTSAEAALLAVLPRELTADCSRGSYAILADSVGAENDVYPAPSASVVCMLSIDSGANTILARVFPPPGSGSGAAGLSAFSPEDFLEYFNDRIAHGGPGDCSAASPAHGKWSIGGEETGAILCYTDASTGDAVLYWSYADRRVLIKALNQKGETAALYQFFLQNARFMAQ